MSKTQTEKPKDVDLWEYQIPNIINKSNRTYNPHEMIAKITQDVVRQAHDINDIEEHIMGLAWSIKNRIESDEPKTFATRALLTDTNKWRDSCLEMFEQRLTRLERLKAIL